MIDREEIKRLFDIDYTYSQTSRERAANDLIFYIVTQWDDNTLRESQLAFRGQFDVLRKAGRGALANLAANPVQVDFDPKDEERKDGGDLADGMYRAGSHDNTSIEAFSNAEQEMVICGMGAWELYTEYEDMDSETNNNQVTKRRPIPEANNTVFFDAGAKLLDKSDARRCTILTAYTEDGYKELREELTGEEQEDVDLSQFAAPTHSYVFPWVVTGSSPTIYVGTFYHREKVDIKVTTMSNPMGYETTYRDSELVDVKDDLVNQGNEVISEKTIKRYQVTKYIVSGAEILNGEMNKESGEREGEIIAGIHIPVVPVYGERSIVEGEEYWEGITRLAKDPQRLRNFQMSFLADYVSKSPRQKPIFFPDQIVGQEKYYELSGPENNFAYVLQNRLSENNVPLPIGPIGIMPEQKLPQALIASIQLSKEAVEDVAPPGLPKTVADTDLSSKAILNIQNQIEQQNLTFQNHMKSGKRRDGEIWASITSETHDVPRTVTTMAPDGTRQKIKMMDRVMDAQTGKMVTLHDLNRLEFTVRSKISADYNSQKEQTLDRLDKILLKLPPGDPLFKIVLLKSLMLTDGVDFDDIRDYSNKELLILGIREPKTDEEKKIVMDAQNQQKEPTAEMVLAMAEDKKGQAAMMKQELDKIKMQLEFQNKNTSNEIDGFGAQTDRMEAQIKAFIADATIKMTNIEAFGKQLENKAKINENIQPIKGLSNKDLMAALGA